MGRSKNRAMEEEEKEALLIATMCIIGHPVDVHIVDGSVYSGLFHTASFDDQFGIVLKDARLTKKGRCEGNVASGSVIKTLVILSSDLVQVVAKGVILPGTGATANIAGDDVESGLANIPEIAGVKAKKSSQSFVAKETVNPNMSSTKSKNSVAHGSLTMKGVKELVGENIPPDHTGNAMDLEQEKRDVRVDEKVEEACGTGTLNNVRLNGDDVLKMEQSHSGNQFDISTESADEVQSSSSSSSCVTEEKHSEEGQVNFPLPSHGDDVCSSGSTEANSKTDVSLEILPVSVATSTYMVPPPNFEPNRASKEFKLNPRAKDFSPSLTNPTTGIPKPVPTATNLVYFPTTSPVVPIAAAAQSEVGIRPFAPRPSAPPKNSQFSDISHVTPGNGGGGPQLTQLIVGQMGNRMLPLRYGGHYNPVQPGSAYLPPSSPAVMVGRLGQVVYMQQARHDVYQNTAPSISPVAARPVLTLPQVPYPKQQGQPLQLPPPPPPPFMPGGQLQFVMPTHVPLGPLLQPPIPANHPIPVPGPNALFSSKFP